LSFILDHEKQGETNFPIPNLRSPSPKPPARHKVELGTHAAKFTSLYPEIDRPAVTILPVSCDNTDQIKNKTPNQTHKSKGSNGRKKRLFTTPVKNRPYDSEK